MIHWGYLNQPQKCLKCYKELEAGTYAAEQGGVIICQDCHSKRWTTPAIERRRAVKLELENDIKCLTMDIIAVGVQLDEAKKELGYAEELRSLRDIYITRQKEFDDTIEAKQQLLKNLELQINECKLEVAWNKLESVLPEVIKASENAEEEAKCWASIKELRNVVIKLVTDILNSQHSARPDLKYALHTIS
jgi:hypothetical protein